jgi:hypothetical protein
MVMAHWRLQVLSARGGGAQRVRAAMGGMAIQYYNYA